MASAQSCDCCASAIFLHAVASPLLSACARAACAKQCVFAGSASMAQYLSSVDSVAWRATTSLSQRVIACAMQVLKSPCAFSGSCPTSCDCAHSQAGHCGAFVSVVGVFEGPHPSTTTARP